MPRKLTSHSYFVVAISYAATETRRAAVEAIVDPEVTRREVVARIKSGEYDRDRVVFIHEIDGLYITDQTAELLGEASYERALDAIDEVLSSDRQAARWDHERALRNEERV